VKITARKSAFCFLPLWFPFLPLQVKYALISVRSARKMVQKWGFLGGRRWRKTGAERNAIHLRNMRKQEATSG